jgi:hypothetical protein
MKTISYEYLKDLLIREKEKRVIIDEFHRLPEEFLDSLQAYGSELNLVLVTSTFWLSRKILEEIGKIENVFSSMEAEKFLVVPEASSLERIPKGIEVVDVNRILELIG